MNHADRQARRALTVSACVAATLVIGKLAAGLWSGSLAVISEALHSATDVLAASIALLAVRRASRSPSATYRYGQGRAENVATVAQGALVVIAALLLGDHAISALSNPDEPPGLVGAGMMIAAACLDVVLVMWLRKVARETGSPAVAADAKQLMVDVFAAAAVGVGLFVGFVTGFKLADPLLALMVSALIAWVGVQMMREGLRILSDQSLEDEDLSQVLECLGDLPPGVVGYHRLRTRRAGRRKYVDLHLTVDRHLTVEHAHQLVNEVENRMYDMIAELDIMIHVEPDGHAPEDDEPVKLHQAPPREQDERELHVVVTGGPYSGRTTAINYLKEKLTDRDYPVYIVPSIQAQAGEDISIMDRIEHGKSQTAEALLDTLFASEEATRILAYADQSKPVSIILHDGGPTLIAQALGRRRWRDMIAHRGGVAALWGRYDLVLHLESGPDQQLHDHLQSERMRADDAYLRGFWLGHNALRFIAQEPDFTMKLRRCLDAVLFALGQSDGRPLITRKFEIGQAPHPHELAQLDAEPTEILQHYLTGDDTERELRVRMRWQADGSRGWSHTKKNRGAGAARKQRSVAISEETYRQFLARRADPNRMPIRKTRYCFISEGVFCQLDVYARPAGRVVLEIEAVEGQATHPPSWLDVLREVTDLEEFLTSNIARQLADDEQRPRAEWIAGLQAGDQAWLVGNDPTSGAHVATRIVVETVGENLIVRGANTSIELDRMTAETVRDQMRLRLERTAHAGSAQR